MRHLENQLVSCVAGGHDGVEEEHKVLDHVHDEECALDHVHDEETAESSDLGMAIELAL